MHTNKEARTEAGQAFDYAENANTRSDLTDRQRSAGRVLRGDRCLCRTCGEYFNSTAAFDKHRVGAYDLNSPHYGRRCRSAAEMLGAGMSRNPAGFWLRGAANTWRAGLPISRRRRDRFEDGLGGGT